MPVMMYGHESDLKQLEWARYIAIWNKTEVTALDCIEMRRASIGYIATQPSLIMEVVRFEEDRGRIEVWYGSLINLV